MSHTQIIFWGGLGILSGACYGALIGSFVNPVAGAAVCCVTFLVSIFAGALCYTAGRADAVAANYVAYNSDHTAKEDCQ